MTCSPGWASSSPTCPPRLKPSSTSTTTGAHASNTSGRASTPLPGQGYRALGFPPTVCATPCSCWPTTSGTSCVASLFQRGFLIVLGQRTAQADKDRSQDYQSLQDDRIPDG